MTLHYDIFSLPVELTIYIYSTLFTITKNGSNKKKTKTQLRDLRVKNLSCLIESIKHRQ